MIQIRKSANTPSPLAATTSSGAKATAALCAAYEKGVRKFEFDNALYGHDEVKTRLKEDQHQKCIFCERKFLAHGYGDVEHFRPKGGFRQAEGDTLKTPGYYWLAYEWSNITFSCSVCNQSHKRNHFPLFNPSARARSHKRSIKYERPIVVDPINEDPTRFVGFRESVAYGRDATLRGETTIKIVGLNRKLLEESRREFLAEKRFIWQKAVDIENVAKQCSPAVQAALRDIINVCHAELRAAAQPQAQYSAMMGAYLRTVGLIT